MDTSILSPRQQLLDSLHHGVPGRDGLVPGLHHQSDHLQQLGGQGEEGGDQAGGVQEGGGGEDGGQVGWG